MPQNPTDKDSAAEERLREAMRAAETRSAEDQAALERVRRKLTKLMLVSLIITFFTLAVVVVVGIYKWTHPSRRAEAAAAQTAQLTPEQEAALAKLRGALIQTAPNSGAEQAEAREKQAQQEKAAGAAKAAAQPEAGAAETAPAANQAAAETAPQNYSVPLAAGEKLVNAHISGNMLLLQIEGSRSGDNLLIYDIDKGQIRARIQLAPAAAASGESSK